MTRRSLTTILLLILSFAVFSNNALANGMDSMGTHAMLAFDMPNHAQQDCCKELNHQQECGCYVAGVVNLAHQISYSHEVLEYLWPTFGKPLTFTAKLYRPPKFV